MIDRERDDNMKFYSMKEVYNADDEKIDNPITSTEEKIFESRGLSSYLHDNIDSNNTYTVYVDRSDDGKDANIITIVDPRMPKNVVASLRCVFVEEPECEKPCDDANKLQII